MPSPNLGPKFNHRLVMPSVSHARLAAARLAAETLAAFSTQNEAVFTMEDDGLGNAILAAVWQMSHREVSMQLDAILKTRP